MTEFVMQVPSNPPAEAWLAMKPIFLDLYLRQDKPLEEVRYHLQTRYAFTASTKAYKLRVKQWSAFKYRKRHKPQVNTTKVKILPTAVTKGHSNRLKASPTSESQILILSDHASLHGFKAKEFTNSMIRMDQHIQDTSVYLCSATRDFWQWTIRSTSSPKTDHVWSSHLAPSWALIDAVTLLSMPSRHHQGQTKLLQVQDAISSSIKQVPAATLLAVISLFTYEKWHPYPGVQAVLFNFIRDYILRYLPLHHPLRSIFEHATSEDMRQVVGQLLVVQVDTLMQIRKEGGIIPDWFFFAPTLGLIQARLLNDAHRVSMHRLQHAESKLKQCRILQMIHRCLFYSRDYEESIEHGLSILKVLDELRTEDHHVWSDLVTTYDMLAKSYAKLDNWPKAIEYYRLAFETGLEQYGQLATNTKYYCHELEVSLCAHGSAEELSRFKEDYHFMFSDEAVSPVSSDGGEYLVKKAHLQASSPDLELALKALIVM